jgi:hypothetical protein
VGWVIRSPAVRSPPAAAESEQFALTPARTMPEREGRSARAKAAAKPKAKKAKEPKTSIEEEFDALGADFGASSAGSSGEAAPTSRRGRGAAADLEAEVRQLEEDLEKAGVSLSARKSRRRKTTRRKGTRRKSRRDHDDRSASSRSESASSSEGEEERQLRRTQLRLRERRNQQIARAKERAISLQTYVLDELARPDLSGRVFEWETTQADALSRVASEYLPPIFGANRTVTDHAASFVSERNLQKANEVDAYFLAAKTIDELTRDRVPLFTSSAVEVACRRCVCFEEAFEGLHGLDDVKNSRKAIDELFHAGDIVKGSSSRFPVFRAYLAKNIKSRAAENSALGRK